MKWWRAAWEWALPPSHECSTNNNFWTNIIIYIRICIICVYKYDIISCAIVYAHTRVYIRGVVCVCVWIISEHTYTAHVCRNGHLSNTTTQTKMDFLLFQPKRRNRKRTFLRATRPVPRTRMYTKSRFYVRRDSITILFPLYFYVSQSTCTSEHNSTISDDRRIKPWPCFFLLRYQKPLRETR